MRQDIKDLFDGLANRPRCGCGEIFCFDSLCKAIFEDPLAFGTLPGRVEDVGLLQVLADAGAEARTIEAPLVIVAEAYGTVKSMSIYAFMDMNRGGKA